MLEVELVLPPDVEIVPVCDLPAEIRARIDTSDGDYAVTRRRSRAPSRIIGKESAALLEEFRSPRRIVDAILTIAGSSGLDPESVLEDAYPLLFNLFSSNMLVAAGSQESAAIENALEVGAIIGGYRLLRCLQVLEDSSVFVGRDDAGTYAAIKYCHPATNRIARALEHEAQLLRRAPNGIAPAVIDLAVHENGVALITEWVFGRDITSSAASLREDRSEAQLLGLCIAVAEAFAGVHDSGVLHGDVHPRNILAEPAGTVRLIDFGLAQDIGQPDRNALRGGVPFYFDPEFARALVSNDHAALTAAAEQYSVAALLYQLWTGVHYADWNLERAIMLRQVIEQPPAPFTGRGITPWPELEQVLGRALDKQPAGRFESMPAFAEALRGLLPAAGARDRLSRARRSAPAPEEDLLKGSLTRYDFGGDALGTGPANAPLASVNYGAAGIAYALYRVAQQRGSGHILALADVWIQKAYELSADDRAFHDPELGVDRSVVGEISLFHSMTGLDCVRGLISIALGDLDGAGHVMADFVARSMRPCETLDLTLGRASTLIGLCELVEALPVPSLVDLGPVRARGGQLAAELVSLLAAESVEASAAFRSLGVAHGWGGYIFALLRWARASATAPDPRVADMLRELASLAEPSGAGIRWPVHNPTRPARFIDGWCNGTAGHAMLFALAYDVLRQDPWAEIAERAAENAAVTQTQAGSLCCGLAGIGYACLAAHRLTGTPRWLERARALARRASADHSRYFFRDSLYKGALGVALLTEELEQPGTAAMPMFEPAW